ncbi:MAG: 30S ribosomal protein S13 [archaeon]
MTEKPKEFKQIVRIAETDVLGGRPVLMALKQIKGVGFSIANAVCNVLNLDKTKKVGELTEEERKAAETLVKNPDKLPKWLYNRRKDIETGEDRHILNVDLKLTKDFDIKRLKKIKSYRGMRHAAGLPVRGQRTKSNFRRGKTIGVQKKSKPGKK